MKYMLLIHQGTTPLPGTDAWNALTPEQQGAVELAVDLPEQGLGPTLPGWLRSAARGVDFVAPRSSNARPSPRRRTP